MAKAKTETPKTDAPKTTAVATTGGGALITHDYGKYAGAGFEGMSAADQAIPFLYPLQPQSPQIIKPSKKIEGAQAGMFLNNVTLALIDGEKGFHFLPCATRNAFVEWVPRDAGGGKVAEYAIRDAVVLDAKRKAKKFNELQVGENDLIETFYCVGIVLDEDMLTPLGYAILSFSSTGIKPYKTGIGELQTFARGTPLFAHRLHISTKQEENDQGTWFNWVIRPAIRTDGNDWRANTAQSALNPAEEPQRALLELGALLAESFLAGTANIAAEERGGGAGRKNGDDAEKF